MKDRSLAIKRLLSCAKGGSSPNGFKQSLSRPFRSFFSKGYLTATLDDISLEAQVSKPTIYQYFKAKEDLLFSLMNLVVEDTGRQMEEVEKRLETGQYRSGPGLAPISLKVSITMMIWTPMPFRRTNASKGRRHCSSTPWQMGLWWRMNECLTDPTSMIGEML